MIHDGSDRLEERTCCKCREACGCTRFLSVGAPRPCRTRQRVRAAAWDTWLTRMYQSRRPGLKPMALFRGVAQGRSVRTPVAPGALARTVLQQASAGGSQWFSEDRRVRVVYGAFLRACENHDIQRHWGSFGSSPSAHSTRTSDRYDQFGYVRARTYRTRTNEYPLSVSVTYVCAT